MPPAVRLRPQRPNHVWSYDLVADRTHDGKAFRMLCIIDEFTRENLAIHIARKLKATDVIEALCDLFVSRGVPAPLRSSPRMTNDARWILAIPRHPTQHRASLAFADVTTKIDSNSACLKPAAIGAFPGISWDDRFHFGGGIKMTRL